MLRNFKQMALFHPALAAGESGQGPGENDRAAALSTTYDFRLGSAHSPRRVSPTPCVGAVG